MNMKNIGVIGTGKVGLGLIKHLANINHHILIANEGHPALLSETASSFGGSVTAVSQDDIISRAEIIFLAVPWVAINQIAEKASSASGKLIIDATNNIISLQPFKTENLGEVSTGEHVQQLFHTHHVVKAFNTLTAETLQNPTPNDLGKTVIFLSGENDSAKSKASDIISLMGFEPVDLGSFKDAANLQEIGRPLSGIEFIKVKGSKVAHKQ
ncbi:NADP oxidoreductase [Pedobacter chinensis]|uniref:NADP oxidoreductase n=1 Tax=Pedobacter chinensis TaxID=2282421 RepID=A0A369Q274_9SPHI|nr:NAD(P)-binding domain-containing protein [Pedobacter chinensis]RDC56428.1 NADP oxidoreductase [Pedobacter chinensis]